MVLDQLKRKFVEAPEFSGSESEEECSKAESNHENSTRNSEIFEISTENLTANSETNQTVMVIQTQIEGEYSHSIPEDLTANGQLAARKRPRDAHDDDYCDDDQEPGGLTIDVTPLAKRMNLDDNSVADAE
ncbi:unnamed protein product [Orchesella dallaii]|uniref:Uncharacterized protein n=1 Tax=Orchesella dallaii TaxID=48710 RepID=A0ABP1QD27_9HEXA